MPKNTHTAQTNTQTTTQTITQALTQTAVQPWAVWAIFMLIFMLGCWLRLDQFTQQILIDDEWHAIFRIEELSIRQLYRNFGYADHSIPMTIYYALLAKLTTVNETLMRLPGMIISIAFIGAAFIYLKTKSPVIALLTALFIACSPLLITYSRIARPYAFVIPFAWVALAAFTYYWEQAKSQRQIVMSICCYSLFAATAIWALPVIGPFVIAPFIYYATANLCRDKSQLLTHCWRLCNIGIPFSLLTLVLILPPLIGSFDLLSAKGGRDLPTLETYQQVVYVWLGNSHTLVTTGTLLLALIGLPATLTQFPIVRSALLGALLILLSIYLSKPAWVFNELTFGRYLMAILPLLFLCASVGAYRTINFLARLRHSALNKLKKLNKKTPPNTHEKQRAKKKNILTQGITLPLIAIISVGLLNGQIYQHSILPAFKQPNNSNTASAYYYFSPNPERNLVQQTIQALPTLTLPQAIKNNPKYNGNLVLAPFYFRSDYWAGPRYEAALSQPVLPGFTNGLCNPDTVIGELSAHPKRNLHFDNFVQLSQENDWINKDIRLFIWQKPAMRPTRSHPVSFDACDALFDKFPALYEDKYVKIFDIVNQPELVNQMITASKVR
ncbi:glycosyltransferase family protein [Ostreibacterium oceani]|uniref:Glycosyltransferase RgtA/B/C/D-like domain-containing protein n=1 Tax=Ostreibacterium oceani TaxID=2654998 RepID=A0A6N7EYZ2_9GAMM|nr:hypothetical protein [Ostreibacterium oceani]MPV86780.1 hypothetical protein [Ostreibacterium oceani]